MVVSRFCDEICHFEIDSALKISLCGHARRKIRVPVIIHLPLMKKKIVVQRVLIEKKKSRTYKCQEIDLRRTGKFEINAYGQIINGFPFSEEEYPLDPHETGLRVNRELSRKYFESDARADPSSKHEAEVQISSFLP